MSDCLIISCSLNPESNSRILAHQLAACLQELEAPCSMVDMREYPLPFCNGHSGYDHPHVVALKNEIEKAHTVLVASPVYNFDLNAVAKNLLEMTGRSWTGKRVGFLIAAGGSRSYMAAMGFANSLQLDFRCSIIPRYVYTDGDGISGGEITGTDLLERIKELALVAARA